MDQLILVPNVERGVIRGQLTFNPHPTRAKEPLSEPEIRHRVQAFLRRNIRLEVDGKACDTRYEVRELWVPAGATVGDIILLRCQTPNTARELRIFVEPSIDALVVSVETRGADGSSGSRSVMISGGTSTPTYSFGSLNLDWREGGANQFLPDGGLASTVSSATPLAPLEPSVRTSASAGEPGRLPHGGVKPAFGIGYLLGPALLILLGILWRVHARRGLAAGRKPPVPKG
jgi:hypothetical protein